MDVNSQFSHFQNWKIDFVSQGFIIYICYQLQGKDKRFQKIIRMILQKFCSLNILFRYINNKYISTLFTHTNIFIRCTAITDLEYFWTSLL